MIQNAFYENKFILSFLIYRTFFKKFNYYISVTTKI